MVTPVQQSQPGLEQHHSSSQDALLSGVAEAAKRLLVIADFDTAVNGALEAIALAAGIDRIFIYENRFDQTLQEEVADCPYEWARPGLISHREARVCFPMVYSQIEGFTHWLTELKAGNPVQVLTKDLAVTCQSKTPQDSALSILTVPIFIGEDYWGNLGFDDCTTKRVWSKAEIAVLETAAACIGSAIERTRTQEAYNQQLRDRDSLLKCVNAAAQCLVANDDLTVALPAMLKILGEGTQQCRAYILRNSQDEQNNQLIFNLAFEWDAPNIPNKIESGAQFPVPISHFPAHLSAPLKAGNATQFFARELDGISPEDRPLGHARSLIGVPITTDGQWWGLLGLDDCLDERLWSEAEVAVLETAATAVGSALERDRSRQAREAAEREILIGQERAARAAELEAANAVLTRRDRWLQTAAAAANQLLSNDNVETSVKAALQIIGENLECDRVVVLQYITEPHASPPVLGLMRLLYEWGAPGIKPQGDYAGFYDIPSDGIEHWFWPLLAGEWVGGLTKESPEPFRSIQQALEIETGYAMPVMVEGVLWGAVCIDYCREVQPLEAAEIAVFRTAATCVASAIYQAQVRRDRAEQNQSAALSAALNTERTRLAREIHDTLAQSFTGVSLQLEAVRGLIRKLTEASSQDNSAPLSSLKDAQTYIRRARDLARQGLSEARRSVHALRSEALETDTLTDALRKMLDQTARDTGLKTQFLLSGKEQLLPDDLQLNLLRIAQEAVTNVLRHARANQLSLSLAFSPNQICLQVIDDGIGFEVRALTDIGGFGLIGIRERAARFGGQMNIVSRPNQGTILEVILPVRAHPINNAA